MKFLGLYEELMQMIFGCTMYNKIQWKKRVWDVTWKAEDKYWKQTAILYRNENLLFKTTANPRYLIWWHLSDLFPSMIKICEDMTKMVCGTSNLKSDNPKLKRETYSNRTCMLCDFGIEENTVHIVTQCPFHEGRRRIMYENFENISMETRNENNIITYKVRRNS